MVFHLANLEGSFNELSFFGTLSKFSALCSIGWVRVGSFGKFRTIISYLKVSTSANFMFLDSNQAKIAS